VEGPLDTSTPTRWSKPPPPPPAAAAGLKLKIRLGKNNVAASSSIVGETLARQPRLSVEDTVTESAEGFHGFADSEVPRYVFDDFSQVDLKTPFKASCSHAPFNYFLNLFFSLSASAHIKNSRSV
jgi:hypothetical protein